MKKQTNGNGRINNTQRNVLSKLAVEVLDKKVQQAKDESGELVAQIREKVKEELGIIAIDMEIVEMEKRIQILRHKKEELGLSKYNDDAFAPGSKARMLLDKRTGTACERVNELEEMKTDVISRIWTAASMEEALAAFDEVRKG